MARVLGRLLELAAAGTPGRLAATLGDEELRYLELSRRANRSARAYAALGVKRHDRILYWSGMSLRSLDAYWGALHVGAVFASINPDLSEAEAGAMVEYVRPALFLVDAARAEAGAAIAAKLGARLAVIGGNGRSGGNGRAVAGTGFERAREQASDAPLSGQAVEEEDIESMFLTSGSTGKPKGVLIPHRVTWLRSCQYSTAPAAASGGGGDLSMFPLFHYAGWAKIINAAAYCRAVHLTAATDGKTLLDLVERWRPTYFYAIPAVWERVLAVPPKHDLRSIRFAMTGTSRVEPALIERVKARFHNAISGIAYGSTEIGRGLGLADDDIARKPYAAGIPPPGVEARLAEGELLIRSDTMMTGYFDLPQQTADVLREGWYCTGDLAAKDDEGYYTITGRRREIIRSGGESVAPAEVEAALRELPGIADVAVVGLPDPRWGEVVCAAIVAAPGAALPTVETLRSRLEGRLATYKHPRRIVAVESLPRTAATGQIQRSQLRDRIVGLDGGR